MHLYQVDIIDRHKINKLKPYIFNINLKKFSSSQRKYTESSCQSRSLSNHTCFILTSAFIHAPGLGPDFEWIWLFLPRSVRLIRSRRLCGGVVGQHLRAVNGRSGVPAAVAGDAVLRTVLAVFPFKWLL